MPEESVKLFISYCHRDETLRQQLDKHLAPLKGQKVIEAWHDRQIRAGDKWASKIDDNLNKADIILLLISPDFVASDYCSNNELKQAVTRHENGEAIIVPVILEPCDWSWLPFAKFQAFPKDGKAITTWGNQNEAFLDIAQGIRKVAQELFAQRQEKIEQKKTAEAEYKAKVEELLSPAGREISLADQDTLDELREKLGLTEEETQRIVEHAYQPYKAQEEKLQKYVKTLEKYIEGDYYPFSKDIEDQLASRQKSLGIKTEDLEKVIQPILAQAEADYQESLQAEEAERQRQLALAAETQRQRELEHQQAYESKLHHYQEEFSKAVQGVYPLSESARNGLRAFQQSLELNAEDAERIEQPILAEAETKYQEKLQAEAAERQHRLALDAEVQRQLEREQAEYEQKLQRYEQELTKAIAAQYPIDAFVRDGLNEFQQSLALSDEDVARIEAPLVAPKEVAYQQQLAEEQRRKEAEERQLELESQEELERQRQEQLKQEAAEKQRQAEAQERQRREAEQLKQQQAEAERLRQEALERQRVLDQQRREEVQRKSTVQPSKATSERSTPTTPIASNSPDRTASASVPESPSPTNRPNQPPASRLFTRRQVLKWAIPAGVGMVGVTVASQFLGRQSPQPSTSSTLSPSATTVDYSSLEGFMKAGQWQEADQETATLMLKVADREKESYLDSSNIENFPCEVLSKIDRLWVKHSNGRFGFSVQKKIWNEMGSPTSSGKDWDRFCVKVGWKNSTATAYVSYSDLKFDPEKSPAGELPGGGGWMGDEKGKTGSLLSRCDL